MSIDAVCGDAVSVLHDIDDRSFDFVFTDPPYPEIMRAYGTLHVPQWNKLLDAVMTELVRVLKPHGSAVLVLMSNSEKVGSLRPWYWEFLARWTRRWNMVQDAYWWNIATPPGVHSRRTVGLLRPSLKICAWFGPADCYRNQDAVLWDESTRNKAMRAAVRAQRSWTGSRHDQHARYRTGGEESVIAASDARGAVTPYNVIPCAHTSSRKHGIGHEGQTPIDLTRWWLSYCCPPAGRVLDPFAGTGTTLRVAHELDLEALGIEVCEQWFEVMQSFVEEIA